MKKRKRNVSRSLILAGVFSILAWLVWQKIYIHVRIDLSIWQALLFFGAAVLVMFLIIDHLFNRQG